MHETWVRIMRSKGAREVRRVEHGRIDRCLQVMSEHGVREEELQRPLILLIAPWSAERDSGLAITHGQRRTERRPRPLAAFDAVWMLGIKVEHLRPRAEAETEALDHRGALQPPSARCTCDQVSLSIRDGNMNGRASALAHSLTAGPGPMALRDGLRRPARQSRLGAARG